MTITHINTSDFMGGAARAAYRIHEAIRSNNIDSVMLVRKKVRKESTIIGPQTQISEAWALLQPKLDSIPKKIFITNQKGPWSFNWVPTNLHKRIQRMQTDIVHIHWIGNGMISISDLGKIKRPKVWTMHDMWPFTGGFHYSDKYIQHDGSLISTLILKSKIKNWKNLNLHLVAPSHWLADMAKKSELFQNKPIKIIPNCLNTEIYKPINKTKGVRALKLDKNKKYILFGAINATRDDRKGFKYLLPAIKKINKMEYLSQVELLVFGADKPKNPPNFGFNTHYLGTINDDYTLALLYSLASVTVVPSRLEAFGQVASESLACSTPVAAFETSGLKEIIDHKINGYLAEPYETQDLAKGIEYCLENSNRLGKNARQKAIKKYSQKVVANQYIELYQSILNQEKTHF